MAPGVPFGNLCSFLLRKRNTAPKGAGNQALIVYAFGAFLCLCGYGVHEVHPGGVTVTPLFSGFGSLSRYQEGLPLVADQGQAYP